MRLFVALVTNRLQVPHVFVADTLVREVMNLRCTATMSRLKTRLAEMVISLKHQLAFGSPLGALQVVVIPSPPFTPCVFFLIALLGIVSRNPLAPSVTQRIVEWLYL